MSNGSHISATTSHLSPTLPELPLGHSAGLSLQRTGRKHGSATPLRYLSLIVHCCLVPVSRPVLTFGDSGSQAELGDLVELHCKALKGSPPIFYQFYHESIILGNSSAPSGGGASFNFFLTAEHSGNFSCEASNGQGAQRSEVVALNLTGICQALGLSRSASLPQHPGERQGFQGVLSGAGPLCAMLSWVMYMRGVENENVYPFVSVRCRSSLDK